MRGRFGYSMRSKKKKTFYQNLILCQKQNDNRFVKDPKIQTPNQNHNQCLLRQRHSTMKIETHKKDYFSSFVSHFYFLFSSMCSLWTRTKPSRCVIITFMCDVNHIFFFQKKDSQFRMPSMRKRIFIHNNIDFECGL